MMLATRGADTHPSVTAIHSSHSQVSPNQETTQLLNEGVSPSPTGAEGAALALIWNENATHFTKNFVISQHLILKTNFITICSAESLHLGGFEMAQYRHLELF